MSLSRRGFMAALAFLVALPHVLLGMERAPTIDTRSSILRRKEYKRARWYRRRERRRNPIGRVLKKLYAELRAVVVPLRTPLIAAMVTGRARTWGGGSLYFDTAVTGPTTTRDTSRDEAPAHYAGTGTASSRFYRNPFVA